MRGDQTSNALTVLPTSATMVHDLNRTAAGCLCCLRHISSDTRRVQEAIGTSWQQSLRSSKEIPIALALEGQLMPEPSPKFKRRPSTWHNSTLMAQTKLLLEEDLRTTIYNNTLKQNSRKHGFNKKAFCARLVQALGSDASGKLQELPRIFYETVGNGGEVCVILPSDKVPQSDGLRQSGPPF